MVDVMIGRALLLTVVVAAALRVMGCGTDDGGDIVGAGVIPTRPAANPQALVDLADRGASVTAQRRALRSYLAQSGISSRTSAAVLRHTRDGIALKPGPSHARSRIGGRPVLPAGERWPTSKRGYPFTFIGAFDLAELPRLDPLPHKGTLVLYWNLHWFEEPDAGEMDFVAATRVYHLPPGAPVHHPDAPEEAFPLDATPLRGVKMPVAGDPGIVAREIKGRPDEDELIAAMNDLSYAGLYPNHLLGAPIEVQSPVLEWLPSFFDPKYRYVSAKSRARFTRAERESGDWVLLAQINEEHGLVIADGGVIHFLILRKDLDAGRFDRVVGIMESH
jgi:hypothetical protein